VEAAAPVENEKPVETEKPREAVKPKEVVARHKTTHASAKPKPLSGPLVLTPIFAKLKAALTASPKTPPKKLAEAKERVPRPQAGVSSGANGTKPR
jgi:hypothetical protein